MLAFSATIEMAVLAFSVVGDGGVGQDRLAMRRCDLYGIFFENKNRIKCSKNFHRNHSFVFLFILLDC